MAQIFNIEAAEKEAFRLSTSKDGLYDIFWGFYLIVLSFSSQLSVSGLTRPWNSLLIGFLALIGLGLVTLIKKNSILPRIGIMKMSSARRTRLRRARTILILSAGLTVLFLGLILAGFMGEQLIKGLPPWISGFRSVGLFGLVVIGLFSFFAHTMDVPRAYLYGVLFALSFSLAVVLEEFAGLTYHLPLLIYGVAVIGVGSFILRGFLRDHPHPSDINEL